MTMIAPLGMPSGAASQALKRPSWASVSIAIWGIPSSTCGFGPYRPRAAPTNRNEEQVHESQRRRRLHAGGGAPLSRPAGPEPGARSLCREDEGGGDRRADAGNVRRHDEGLGADERG